MRAVPPETLPPVVQKQDPDADPIMSIMISSTSASLRTLTEIADKQVKRALESVDGVGAVTMSGDRSREIHIVVDVEKLNAHGLSIDQVVNAIQTGERRDSRRHARAGQVGGRPAHAGPRRGHRAVQRHHRRHGERRPAPRVRYRLRRGLGQEGGDLAVHGRRTPGRAARHPPRIRREHDQGDRRRQGEARRPFVRRCRPTSRSRSPPTTPGSSTPPSRRSRST